MFFGTEHVGRLLENTIWGREIKMSSGMKKFILLWMGELISSIGGGLTSFGLGVYVFQKTGSAAGMALVTLLGFLPTLLFTVPAGVLATVTIEEF